MKRRCSRSACSGRAVATLTFVYADQMAVLGPLALQATPGCYDLCAQHAQRLSVPRGWEVLKLTDELTEPGPDSDDLLALANAVREVGFSDAPASAPHTAQGLDEAEAGTVVELGRRGHLRVIADADLAGGR